MEVLTNVMDRLPESWAASKAVDRVTPGYTILRCGEVVPGSAATPDVLRYAGMRIAPSTPTVEIHNDPLESMWIKTN